MADIKMKKKNNTQIKKFDKAKIYSQKLKENIVETKEKNSYEKNDNESSATEYGINQITDKTKRIAEKGTRTFNQYGQKSAQVTKRNIQETTANIKQKVENYKIKNNIKTINDIKNTNLKKTQRTIKNTPNKIKTTTKMTRKTVTATTKVMQKTYQITKMTIKNTIKGVKTGIKATISTIKGIIAGTKALISLLLAGGWIAVLIIVIICLIGLICSSVFGIFFSNEKGANSRTMSSVVSEINTEFANKISEIQTNTEHEDYEINSNRAEWKDIIAVYAVLVSGGEEQSDVITLDDKKIEKLRSIFWEMNTISSRTEDIEKEIEITDDKGNKKIEKVTRKVLYIEITSKSVDEMISIHNLNEKQKKQLAELQKAEYNSMWSNVLYGSSAGSTDIVQVAFSQIGNVGGQPFWSWYGFDSRVEWCACFVSWCANECRLY